MNPATDPRTDGPQPEPTLESIATGNDVSPLELIYRRRVDAADRAVSEYVAYVLNNDPRYTSLSAAVDQAVNDLCDVRLEQGLETEE